MTAFFTRREKTIEKRVKRLLYLDDLLEYSSFVPRFEKLPKIEFTGAALIFSFTLLSTLLLAPLAVHRATEFLFQTIK